MTTGGVEKTAPLETPDGCVVIASWLAVPAEAGPDQTKTGKKLTIIAGTMSLVRIARIRLRIALEVVFIGFPFE